MCDTTTQQFHVKAKEMHRSVNYGFVKNTISHFMVLELELANIYCKEQDSKYFRICGSYSQCCNYSALLLQCESSHRHYVNE